MKIKKIKKQQRGFLSNKFLQIKTNTKLFLWRLFGRIKYGNFIFLDSNMIMSNNHKSDGRTKRLRKYSNYFITDVVSREIDDLGRGGLNCIFSHKYKIVNFSDLRKIIPSLCPVYYNFISWMYNPANITTPEFSLHLLQSLKLRGRTLTKDQDTLYNYLMDRLKSGAENNTDALGHPKSLLAKNIDLSAFQYFKKKIKNRKSSNLLNDYKNVSIILLFALLNKKNTSFVTADRDLLAVVLTLIDSIVQGMAFPYFFLPTLTRQDTNNLLSGKRITRFIDFKKFEEYIDNLRGDILSSSWQKDHIFFKIRLWDTKNKCFVEDLTINFNDLEREMILNMHGSLSCPYAKNNTHGNWLFYRYWPPPLKSPNVLKVLLSAKPIKNRRNVDVPEIFHQQTCKYAIDDKNDKLKEYYGFWC
jgi:hypothetical protein